MPHPTPKDRRRASRREFLRTGAGAIGSLAIGACATRPPAQAGPRPNLLLFCTDQQHHAALGCVDPFFDTPHLDALAGDSVRFSHMFCPTPQCSATRSTLYTGLYPHKTTVIGNVGSADHQPQPVPALPVHFETIGSRLRAAGYHTGYVGKWHLGNEDHFRAHFDLPLLSTDPRAGATRSACAFLERRAAHPQQPFALFVNYIDPHDIYEFSRVVRSGAVSDAAVPVPHPASWADTLEGKPAPQAAFIREDQGDFIYGKPDEIWEAYRLYYREKCRLADAEIGAVLQRLRDLGLYDHTVVAATSDHGDMDTHHRLVFKGPFMYDQLVRVPLLVRVPGSFGGVPAQTMDHFVHHADLFATLCDFAGADPGRPDGHSLRPLLSGQGAVPPRDFMVSQYYCKQTWVNPIRMIRTRRWKHNRYRMHGEELYDLEADSDELHNRANDPACARTKSDLDAQLRQWMREQGDSLFDTYAPTHRDGSPWFA